MSALRKIGVAWVIVQSLAILYAASSLHLLSGTAEKAYGWYSGYTGTNMRYGFFAPNVGTQFRAFFDVVDAKGERRVDVLNEHDSAEASIRLTNVIALYAAAAGKQDLQRALVASWAGKVLARNPGAREVWARIEAYNLPSLAEYHSGLRPKWVEIYRAKFAREKFGKEKAHVIDSGR